MRRVLDTAGKRFRDFPRMVANRAVQLEDMLREKDISERAPQLIALFSDVAGEARNVESFGPYRNSTLICACRVSIGQKPPCLARAERREA